MRASAILLLEAVALFAAPPMPATKPGIFPPIIQPDSNPSPPAPKPVPGSVPVLSGDVIYVLSQEEPFLLFASPMGLVTVTRETGPLKVRAKFLDGTGKVETRTFTGKHIAIIEAVGKGKVELIAVPAGVTDEGSAQRMMIEANHGGQPPPDDGKKDVIPDPKPKPPPVDPEPKPNPAPAGPYFFVTVTETAARTPAEAKVLNDTAFWNTLRAAGHDWRMYDKDEPNAVKGGYAKVYGELGSCLVIVTLKGTVVKKVPLPKTTAEVTAILKELEGAK